MMPRWFAKRFLHPDIVAEYGYIFLWDEDLGVESFHPQRYVIATVLAIDVCCICVFMHLWLYISYELLYNIKIQ